MIGVLLVSMAVAAALLAAASLRLASLVSTLLAAYLALVANLAIVTWALSPLREVTRTRLAVTELVLLLGAVVAWWRRGRPRLPLRSPAAALREFVRDPAAALFLVFVVAADRCRRT